MVLFILTAAMNANDCRRFISKDWNDSQTNARRSHNGKPCKIGVGVPVAPRKLENGTEVEYWQSVLSAIPLEVDYVAVLSRMPRSVPLIHPRVDLVIQAEPGDQPDFDPEMLGRELKHTFHDGRFRVKWRSSLVLDFARMIHYLGEFCHHVLWIEDDAILTPGWFDEVKHRVIPHHKNWAFQELSERGTVAVILNSKFTHLIAQYCIHNFDKMPLDWLLDSWAVSYEKKHPKLEPVSRYPIIGHKGIVSTFKTADIRIPFSPKFATKDAIT